MSVQSLNCSRTLALKSEYYSKPTMSCVLQIHTHSNIGSVNEKNGTNCMKIRARERELNLMTWQQGEMEMVSGNQSEFQADFHYLVGKRIRKVYEISIHLSKLYAIDRRMIVSKAKKAKKKKTKIGRLVDYKHRNTFVRLHTHTYSSTYSHTQSDSLTNITVRVCHSFKNIQAPIPCVMLSSRKNIRAITII